MNSCRYENPLLCSYHRRINKTHLHLSIKTRNIRRKLDYKPPTCTSDTFPRRSLLIFRCFALTCCVFTPNQELHQKPTGMCWLVRCVSDCWDTWLAVVAWCRARRPKSLPNFRRCTNPQWKSSPSMVHRYFLENIFAHLSSGCSSATWRQSNDLVWFSQKAIWFGVGWKST